MTAGSQLFLCCLRALRFLGPQESLNQAIEEGPLSYSSETGTGGI